MNSEPSEALLKGFLDTTQAWAKSYLGLVAQQQALLSSAGTAAPGPLSVPVTDAGTFAELQRNLVAQHTQLWQSTMQRMAGAPAQPLIEPNPADRRFSAPEWTEIPAYDYLRQAYLLNADFLTRLAETMPIEDGPARTRMRFLTRLFVEAMSPSNYALTNPEFVKAAVESKGESVTAGLRNMLEDLQKGRVSMTDEEAFEIGRNIAVTPGSVIYENEVIQLIQYTPTTDEVAERPILLVPPCINKFYLMDLQPENSFVRYLVEQGFTVFLVSWRSATPAQGQLTWDDYVESGPMKALSVVREITGVAKPNVLGFCIGGPLVVSTLAVLKARGEDPVESLTLMTALLDYSEPGEVGSLITEATVAGYEASIGKGGVMRGRELAAVFSALRSNDLIWQYVAGNYLKGGKPAPFDLLYWNSDSTDIAGPCFTYYLRNTYLANNLRVPGKLTMLGEKIDLGRIDVPAYIMAAREDHLVVWNGAYLSRRLLGGPTKFTLAASGHIAGSINPASKNRRSYWVNEKSPPGATAEQWLADAEERKGSWWPHWIEWLRERSGPKVKAPQEPGNATYRVIEPAPGRYVKVKTAPLPGGGA